MAAEFGGQAQYLVGIAELVIVPDIQHHLVALGQGRLGVDDTGRARADKIARDDFGLVSEADLLGIGAVAAFLEQYAIDLFD